MFQKAYFANKSREEIKKKMQEEGFSPLVITDKPGFIYKPHQHATTKYLVCIEGSMEVTVNGKTYDFGPGDKLIIEGNTKHSAQVGKDGCVFFWSEKIVG
jgi:quercetin dioxygenase-like cupin family protein